MAHWRERRLTGRGRPVAASSSVKPWTPWWSARLPEDGAPGALTTEQRTALELSMADRRAADPDAYRTELQSCVGEAIEGGALP